MVTRRKREVLLKQGKERHLLTTGDDDQQQQQHVHCTLYSSITIVTRISSMKTSNRGISPQVMMTSGRSMCSIITITTSVISMLRTMIIVVTI